MMPWIQIYKNKETFLIQLTIQGESEMIQPNREISFDINDPATDARSSI